MNQNFFHHKALQILFFQRHKLPTVKHFSARTHQPLAAFDFSNSFNIDSLPCQ